MAKTCIICGGATGSREHIFPAALGGRRTNKGIYCGTHNGAYSGLASTIKNQLALFNAQLGVIGDHADERTSVTMTDVASGEPIELDHVETRFKGPPRISETVVEGQKVTQARFSSQKEADDWISAQRAKGISVQIVGKPTKATYHLGTAHIQLKLGGTTEGMQAIGYIAQTFLAHYFPDIARLPELRAFKDYTLLNQGDGLVWWDFEPPDDLPPNKFQFGHRIVVGQNATHGSVYARVSLFSALNFAVLLGSVTTDSSRAVITDMNPLAQSPPDDIYTWSESAAKSAVSKPKELSASLSSAIESGKAQGCLNELMRRISDFQLEAAARTILEKTSDAATTSQPDRERLFAQLVASRSQRVLQLIQSAAKDCKARASTPIEHAIADGLERASALDPNSANGLTVEATRALAIASAALAKRMREDFEAGLLDLDRLKMLIGGGPGMHVVAAAIAEALTGAPLSAEK
jgi:hypothetical protein